MVWGVCGSNGWDSSVGVAFLQSVGRQRVDIISWKLAVVYDLLDDLF